MSTNTQPQRSPPAIDPGAFQGILNRPSVAKELFLPGERAGWEGDVYTFGRGEPLRPRISGVRLQEPDRNKQDSGREKACQADLTALVRSVVEMRKTPPLAGVVLSREVVVGRDASQPDCKRVIFGLTCPADGRFKNDAEAAGECHRQIIRGVGLAGFRVEHPKTFDRFSPWLLLLLLPLLLLLLLPWSCPPPAVPPPTPGAEPPRQFFGMQVETSSFLIVVDKSGSMQPYFPAVRAEAKRLLDEMIKPGQGVHYADVIVYDAEAKSALGQIEPLTPAVVGRLGAYLDALQAGGGTELSKAVDLAAQEVIRHGKKTTLLILTDGEDNTLHPMIQSRDQVKGRFGGVEVSMHTTTPRLFTPGADPAPANPAEVQLRDFSQTFNGRFGPQKGSP
jgi:hypothetical protein